MNIVIYEFFLNIFQRSHLFITRQKQLQRLFRGTDKADSFIHATTKPINFGKVKIGNYACILFASLFMLTLAQEIQKKPSTIGEASIRSWSLSSFHLCFWSS